MARHRVRNLDNNPHETSEVEGHRQPEPTKLPYMCPFPSCGNHIFGNKSETVESMNFLGASDASDRDPEEEEEDPGARTGSEESR